MNIFQTFEFSKICFHIFLIQYFSMINNYLYPDFFLINVYVSTIVENYFEQNPSVYNTENWATKNWRVFVYTAPHLRSDHEVQKPKNVQAAAGFPLTRTLRLPPPPEPPTRSQIWLVSEGGSFISNFPDYLQWWFVTIYYSNDQCCMYVDTQKDDHWIPSIVSKRDKQKAGFVLVASTHSISVSLLCS